MPVKTEITQTLFCLWRVLDNSSGSIAAGNAEDIDSGYEGPLPVELLKGFCLAMKDAPLSSLALLCFSHFPL